MPRADDHPEHGNDRLWGPDREDVLQSLGGLGSCDLTLYRLNPTEKKKLAKKRKRGVGFKLKDSK